jgi:hypothetical protein
MSSWDDRLLRRSSRLDISTDPSRPEKFLAEDLRLGRRSTIPASLDPWLQGRSVERGFHPASTMTIARGLWREADRSGDEIRIRNEAIARWGV